MSFHKAPCCSSVHSTAMAEFPEPRMYRQFNRAGGGIPATAEREVLVQEMRRLAARCSKGCRAKAGSFPTEPLPQPSPLVSSE